MSNEQMIVEDQGHGERLDIYLSRRCVQNFSRSQIKKQIDSGKVKVNAREVSAHYHVKKGDVIEFEKPPSEVNETRAEEIPLEIVYEDKDLLIVNKPAGMVVHPAHGNLQHTLVNALLYHVNELSKVGEDPIRPGIVHRLDKDTSGILVVAKTNQAHAALAHQFKEHTIERVYQTAVRGVVQHEEGVCEEPVGRAFLSRKKVVIKPSGGKDAVTYFRVMKRFKKSTLLAVFPQTGRTHQIRVHLAHLGHPVLGDSLYGIVSPGINRQALHAFRLAFTHPRTGERLSFESDLPPDMKSLLTYLESES